MFGRKKKRAERPSGGGAISALGIAGLAAGGFEIVRGAVSKFGEQAAERGMSQVIDQMNLAEAWTEIKAMVADLHRTVMNWPVWTPSKPPSQPSGGKKKGSTGPSGKWVHVDGIEPSIINPDKAKACKKRFDELVTYARDHHKLGLLKVVLGERWRRISDNTDNLDDEKPRHTMKRLLVILLSQELERIWEEIEDGGRNIGIISSLRAKGEDTISAWLAQRTNEEPSRIATGVDGAAKFVENTARCWEYTLEDKVRELQKKCREAREGETP